ncbi:FecR domain-containing protein [Massilia violaceinigra]|uniref:FecR domain-containing protein n=1 Tax=Massilia violaceinigra TaxID=2045208 RepID=A0ABY4AF30_9BURK|nr:FecR family protein [Massilia violaceinigra]UOD31178.1 FecR domain-containing protein [Massilia violaceinigra]
MFNQSIVTFRTLSVALALSWAAAGQAAAAEAARVVFVTGEVQLASKAAALDNPVQEGDEISTGAQGYVYMKTVDGGFLILRPNSRARIIAYKVDAANPANTRVKLELLSGVARSISGQGVKLSRQNFRFNTPVAAIGVRGTDFIVSTDQLTTRIAVVSGGVVVSGFAGACGPEGGGPCEGRSSRELFAGQPGMLLQVEKGQLVPKLLNNPDNSPNQAVPPRSDEPSGRVAATTTVPALPGTTVNLDAKKDAINQISKPPLVPVLPPVPPVVLVPVPVPDPVVVVPEVPKGPEVLWGRYERIAGTVSDPEVVAKLRNPAYDEGYFVGSYAIKRRLDAKMVLPSEGQASFALAEGSASLTRKGGDAQAAAIKEGSLNVNFGAQSFETSMLVRSHEGELRVRAVGQVWSNGTLAHGPDSNTALSGYLTGGDKVNGAEVIFKSINGDTWNAQGWTAQGYARFAR